MDISTALMFAQTASTTLGGISGVKGAKKVAKLQKETLDKYYKYNKGQISKAYDNAYKNMMTQNIMQRNNLTEQTKDIQSQLNVKAIQDGVNTSDNSFTGDMGEQLKYEFNVGMQDLLTSQANQTASIIAGMVTQEMQLEQQYSNSINGINQMVGAVEDKAMGDIFSSVLQSGVKGFEDYRGATARDPNTKFGSWVTSFNTKNLLGGKK